MGFRYFLTEFPEFRKIGPQEETIYTNPTPAEIDRILDNEWHGLRGFRANKKWYVFSARHLVHFQVAEFLGLDRYDLAFVVQRSDSGAYRIMGGGPYGKNTTMIAVTEPKDDPLWQRMWKGKTLQWRRNFS